MKREDVKNKIPGITDEQLNWLMQENGADINREKSAATALQTQLNNVNAQLKTAQDGLADAHDDEPERARDPQNICKLIRARDACDQADDPEHSAKTGSCAGAKQNRADDDGNQRQRDRDRPNADAACDGLQNDDQRGQQGQRGQTDDG